VKADDAPKSFADLLDPNGRARSSRRIPAQRHHPDRAFRCSAISAGSFFEAPPNRTSCSAIIADPPKKLDPASVR